MLKKKASLSALRTTCLLLGGILSVACTGNNPTTPNGETFEVTESGVSFQGESRSDALSRDEMAAYQAARMYVRNLVSPGQTAYLNHADDRQHQFVVLRLRLAGKTPQNSPELFRKLAELRASHQARGLQSGTVDVQQTNTWGNQHFLPTVNVISSTEMQALALAARKDAVHYGYVDSATWDSNGTPLGNMTYAEVWGGMPATHIRSVGNPSQSSVKDYEGDSFLSEDTVYYGYRTSYTNSRTTNRIMFNTPVVSDPADIKYGDRVAAVCLNRTWTQDCDYDLTGTPTALKIPLRGSISISDGSYNQGFRYDLTKIDEYRRGVAVDSLGKPDPGGSIRVTLTSVGGGCDVSSDASLPLAMQAFWRGVTVDGTQKTLSWDLSGANAALFDESCRQVQNKVYLTMSLNLPWIMANGAKGPSSIYMTNAPADKEPHYRFVPITITNSCLAEGTKIELADGRTVAIEDLKIGDQIFNSFSATSTLTVTDTAKGYELVPMVRAQDEAGRSILMTEMHPLQVVGRGMVLAKALRVGDQVMTRSGPSKLVSVTREKFSGNVYNVKVGTVTEALALGTDQTVVFANGFLVGDGQIQSKYETIEQSSRHLAKAKLPMRWYQDYKNVTRR